MWITRVSINNPVFATMVMVGIAVLGLFAYNRLRIEQMPDVSLPYVLVLTTYPGANPEVVETDVTKPLEYAINTVAGANLIRSNSREGQSQVFAEFRMSTDMTKAMQDVRDKISQVRPSFPRDVKEPLVIRADQENTQPVVSIAVLSPTMNLRDLTSLTDQTIVKGLENVPGVARIDVNGRITRQILVQIKPTALTALGISVDQVAAAIRAANQDVPAGRITRGQSDSIVRVEGKIKDPAQFGRIIVAMQGSAPIYLSQIADVIDGEKEPDSIARINGRSSITLDLQKSQDANMVDTGKGVAVAVEALKKRLPPDVEMKIVNSVADEVEKGVNRVKSTILEGAGLTVLIVFLFLHSWRSTIITGLTLPISVIATFIALYGFGFTLNNLTLMALSLCIGLLIDDAIVVRENIVRHIHMGKDHYSAAREGTEEIGLAVLATTFSIVAVFVPIAFMSGIVGKFFFPFGITVAAAVLVSLFVSFTLDPMLSAIWRDPPEGARNIRLVGPLLRRFEKVIGGFHSLYDALLRAALGHRKTTLAIAFASFAASIPIAGLVGTEMMPEADESFTSVRLTMPVGSSLEYADAQVRRVEAVLREFKEIEVINTGLGVGADLGKNTARINLKLVPRSERTLSQKQLEQAIRKRVEVVPGVELRVGWGGPIYVALLGNNDAEMRSVIADLRQKILAIRGITDVEVSFKEGTPALSVHLRPELAAEYGLSHAQLGTMLRAFIGGENSGYWLAPDGQNYEVITQLPRASRTILEDVASLNIATGRQLADGAAEVIPLRSVATIERTFSPENIRRQDLQRRIALWANVQGRPSGDAGEEVQELVKSYVLPPGLRFDIGGQIRDQQDINAAILGALALAVIFIYIVLASQFGSFLQPLAIMASLPLSVVGVMLALLVTGTTLNIFSMIGIVFLMGLVTKNAILLVDFANKGQRDGLNQAAALLAAGQVRLRPILMTTAAMIFGMLPLALGLGEGAEQQAPMGRAIIGGVITSTLLTLVVVPVIYSYLDALDRRLKPRSGGAGALARQPQDRA